MSANTSIEWTDATWNPVTGCTRVSPGCTNCYAERLAATRLKQSPRYKGVAEMRGGEPRWTGTVRLHPEILRQPLRWRKPRRVFVCSQSDLFHEDVPDEFIALVFTTMSVAKEHTFQVLTKRPDRMAAWLDRCGDGGKLGWITHDGTEPRKAYLGTGIIVGTTDNWPLRNVWIGTSVEDQQRADERIPHLLRCPAAVRFLSCEPLLGPVDLRRWMVHSAESQEGRCRVCDRVEGDVIHARLPKDGSGGSALDWIIVGGESGPGARPMHVAWARSIVEQCRDAGVACFYKQGGSAHSCEHSSKGGCLKCAPEDLRVREMPDQRRRQPSA